MIEGEHTMKLRLSIGILLMTSFLFACGGGGGGGNSAPPQPSTAVIKVAAQGTPSNSPISGIQVILHLPAGVSVKSAQSAPQTDPGVVTATGNAAGAELVIGTYSVANNTLSLSVIKSSGFAAGEFATVNCDIAAGTFPVAADFSLSNLAPFDTNGAAVTGLTAAFTASIN
jgi:hypothetical protein